MNRHLFEASWRQLRGQVKTWWRQLTDDDLDRVAGNFDEFLGLLQNRYGYSRKAAEEEFYRRMASLREMREKRLAVEFKRRLSRIEVRQKNHLQSG